MLIVVVSELLAVAVDKRVYMAAIGHRDSNVPASRLCSLTDELACYDLLFSK